MKAYHDGRVTVHGGDCLAVLAELPADSFDAVVTDPPYHFASIVKRFGKTSLGDETETSARSREGRDSYARAARGFMGKQWDGGQIAHEPETWAAVLRVMKPGAHLVAFHAPKNWHRLALAIEDAGFEIRDTLLYLFGSGFPKSHNMDHQRGKLFCGCETVSERDVRRMHEADLPEAIDASDQRSEILQQGLPEQGLSQRRTSPQTSGTWPLCERCGKPIIPAGLGTALKPAYEPIVLARRPLVGTIAANVMAHGTGALNIDACRVNPGEVVPGGGNGKANNGGQFCGEYRGERAIVKPHTLGRWPANVVHDGSDEVVSGFPESQSGEPREPTGSRQRQSSFAMTDGSGGKGDSGSAARFFYTAKADADDRLGSKHPTVKPLDLMQWLVRLITPSGGHILDPFAGTGTTAEAALREGFRCTLIEREAEYLADIDRRMAHVFDGEVGRGVAIAKMKPERTEPAPLLDYIEEAKVAPE